jgi:hypothetical protein
MVLSLRFTIKILPAFLRSPTRAKRSARLIFPFFVTLMTFGEQQTA